MKSGELAMSAEEKRRVVVAAYEGPTRCAVLIKRVWWYQPRKLLRDVWCYAMSGTELMIYELCCTDIAYGAISLRACYAMSGTEIAYAVSSACARATRCPRMVLPADRALAPRLCEVLPDPPELYLYFSPEKEYQKYGVLNIDVLHPEPPDTEPAKRYNAGTVCTETRVLLYLIREGARFSTADKERYAAITQRL
eukprot:174649-Rhodomonas_salina.1